MGPAAEVAGSADDVCGSSLAAEKGALQAHAGAFPARVLIQQMCLGPCKALLALLGSCQERLLLALPQHECTLWIALRLSARPQQKGARHQAPTCWLRSDVTMGAASAHAREGCSLGVTSAVSNACWTVHAAVHRAINCYHTAPWERHTRVTYNIQASREVDSVLGQTGCHKFAVLWQPNMLVLLVRT